MAYMFFGWEIVRMIRWLWLGTTYGIPAWDKISERSWSSYCWPCLLLLQSRVRILQWVEIIPWHTHRHTDTHTHTHTLLQYGQNIFARTLKHKHIIEIIIKRLSFHLQGNLNRARPIHVLNYFRTCEQRRLWPEWNLYAKDANDDSNLSS